MSIRSIWRSRSDLGTALAIVLLLSFGFGTAAVLYTALDRLLLHPLPIPHPETFFRAAVSRPPIVLRDQFTYSTFEAIEASKGFKDAAAQTTFGIVSFSDNQPTPVICAMVSDDFFRLFDVRPTLGRFLSNSDFTIGQSAPPVVLSNRYWISHLGGSKDVIGRTLLIRRQSFTIVGVAPTNFSGFSLDSIPDVWIPVSAQPLLSRKPLRDPDPDRYFSIFVRLYANTSVQQAQTALDAQYKMDETAAGDTDPGRAILEPISAGAFALHDQFKKALSLLLSGLALLLVLIWANVAGLLLARTKRLERETAVRLALGASRMRIAGRALLESLLLGLAGATGSILVAVAFAPILIHMLPQGRETVVVTLTPSLKIIIIVYALSLIVSLTFGTVPALAASRTTPQTGLRGGSATKRSGYSSRCSAQLHSYC
jgi:putative ABC transport system permease protein